MASSKQSPDEVLPDSMMDTPNSELALADCEKQTSCRPREELAEPTLSPPPDGGSDAWLVVMEGFCTVFASFGWINCIGIFQDYYQTAQLVSYSPSAVAWIPSTESFMMFFCGPLSGMLVDNYGPRFPILLGSLLHVFGFMMTSISKEYYQIFLSQSVCSAIGCGFLFNPTIAACGTWFAKRRALAFGVVVSGSSIGGVILPIMVQRLIAKVGFGWAMRSTAFLILVLLVIGNFAVKSRLPPPGRKVQPLEFLRPFAEVPFLLLTTSAFFIYLGGFLPFNFIIVQARASGMSADLAEYLVPIINAASTFGRIVPAQLGDMYGIFNVMIIHTLLGAVFSLAVWLPAQSTAPLIVFGVLYGFTSGCMFSIIPAMIANISDARKLGVRSGSMYAVAAVGALIGSPIAGAIVNKQNGDYSGLIIFAGGCLMMGTAFAVLTRHSLVGSKLWVKV